MRIQSVDFYEGKTCINLTVPDHITNTTQIPGFSESILKKLPTLKEHICYNELGQTFEHELNDTLLAHVFEHVLIELMGKRIGYRKNIKGYTSWNWYKNPRGSYQIEIHHPDKELLFSVLKDTISLINNTVKENTYEN